MGGRVTGCRVLAEAQFGDSAEEVSSEGAPSERAVAPRSDLKMLQESLVGLC